MKIEVTRTPILITALLCILKLVGILNISWFWCFCLIWLPFAIVLGLIALMVIMIIIYAIFYVISESIK